MRSNKGLSKSCTSHNIHLEWNHGDLQSDGYIVKYHPLQYRGKVLYEYTRNNFITLNNLKSNTTYEITIRSCHNEKELLLYQERQKTEPSTVDHFVKISEKISDCPAVYQLPVKVTGPSEGIKCHELVLDSCKSDDSDEKTIILLGESKTGKTTLVDAIINYSLGVSFADDYRLTVTQYEEDETESTHWYRICGQESFTVPYTLNIIEVSSLIINSEPNARLLIQKLNGLGINYIDACFLVVPAQIRSDQRNVFNNILKYLKEKTSIFPIITFDDDDASANLRVVTELANIYQLGEKPVYFKFNNSDLLKQATGSVTNWEKRDKSFKTLFKILSSDTPQPLRIPPEPKQAQIVLHSTTNYFRQNFPNKSCSWLLAGIACSFGILLGVCSLFYHRNDHLNPL